MKPKRIFFIRHGQSIGNVDRNHYETVPDWKIHLTDKGREEAKEAGEKLHTIIGGEPLGVYLSPYTRTRDTWRGLVGGMNVRFVKEDPRLREQEWGNYMTQAQKEIIDVQRDEFGTFFYRIAGGESGADVYDRATGFLDSIYRDFEKDDFPENVLIVTHGFTLRILLMRWLHWSVEHFQALKNPKNCEMFAIEKNEYGKFYMPIPYPIHDEKTKN